MNRPGDLVGPTATVVTLQGRAVVARGGPAGRSGRASLGAYRWSDRAVGVHKTLGGATV